MIQSTILVGAVTYAPKVVSIWEGLREHFQEQFVPMDFVLYSNYERQVEALIAGHIHVAWNTPLAHVRLQQFTSGRSLSLGMRDTDRDFHSRVIVRKDAGIKTLDDLAGKTLAVGTKDSPQARILPLYFLKQVGAPLSLMRIQPHDLDIGKHGDTGTSERAALQALRDGQAEAATVGDLIWSIEQEAGRIDPEQLETLWVSPAYDDCMFDAGPDFSPDMVKRFQQALFSMQWDNPRHQKIMDLEGLKQWLPPREEGYASLREALREQEPRG